MKLRWTVEETQKLKEQIEKGVPLNELKLEGRSHSAIRYKVYGMGINFVRWKKNEISLLEELIKDGKKPWEIEIPGRSKNAIRNKSVRSECWQTKKRLVKSWNLREIKLLKKLVMDCGYTAKMAISNGYFPNRSRDSISQQMRRMHLKRLWSKVSRKCQG